VNKIRLLIASEDSSARRGLTAIFSSENAFEVLGGFTLQEAIEKSLELQPDVVLVDAPADMNGYGSKVRQIKNGCPCSIIIALVENDRAGELAGVLAQRIDSCVPKGIMRGCLVKTVELACRAGIFCLPGTAKKMISFNGEPEARHCNGQAAAAPAGGEPLTKREMEILQLLAQNYSNREIAGKLFISEPTVKTHVSSILRKLGQSNRAQAIVYSYKMGLVSEPRVVSSD